MAEYVYSIRQAATLFGVAQETVRTWTEEFSDYLSDKAKPGKNKHRAYTLMDMQVLSLIAEMKREGLQFRDIHASLKNGQRGEVPTHPPAEIQAITATGTERHLALQVEQQQHLITKLEHELAQAQTALIALQDLKEKNIRLEERLIATEGGYKDQIEQLQVQIRQLHEQVRELSLQAGKQYAQGFVDGIKQSNE